jgi:hypothetical protein
MDSWVLQIVFITAEKKSFGFVENACALDAIEQSLTVLFKSTFNSHLSFGILKKFDIDVSC